ETTTKLEPSRVRQIERLLQGNRVSPPCRHQTQSKRMIVLQPPLVRHFLEQHQMLKREIVCIIDNQKFRPILVQVSHDGAACGCSNALGSGDLKPPKTGRLTPVHRHCFWVPPPRERIVHQPFFGGRGYSWLGPPPDQPVAGGTPDCPRRLGASSETFERRRSRRISPF